MVSIPLLSPARHGTLQPQLVLPGRETVWLTRDEAVTRHEPIPVVHDVAARHLRQCTNMQIVQIVLGFRKDQIFPNFTNRDNIDLGQRLEGGTRRWRRPVILHNPDL